MANYGNERIVRLLLENDADVDRRSCNGIGPFPLHASVQNGEITKMLLKRSNATVNLKHDNTTPLFEAVKCKNKRTVSLLIKYGAQVLMKHDFNRFLNITALQYDLDYYQDMNLARILIEAGSDVNSTTYRGDTALHIAARNINIAMVEYLLSRGADFNIINGEGKTAFRTNSFWKPLYFDSTSLDDIYKYLEDWNLSDCETSSAQSTASSSGANVDQQKNITVLHAAVYRPIHRKIREIIIEGKTYSSASHGFSEVDINILKFLLESQADVNLKDKFGMTPLLQASLYPSEKVIELLINAGAQKSINEVDELGNSPLMYAVSRSQSGVVPVKMLINAGAGLNIENNDDDTALSLALNLKNFNFTRMLIIAGAKDIGIKSYATGVTALHMAVENNDVLLIEILLSKDDDIVNVEDDDGQTPLHWAARLNHLEVIQTLIKNNADKNILDSKGDKPIDILKRNNPQMEEAELEAIFEPSQQPVEDSEEGEEVKTKEDDADNSRNHAEDDLGDNLTESEDDKEASKSKTSELHLAVKDNDVQKIELLLSQGIDVDLKDDNNQTPMHWAAKLNNGESHLSVIKKLLENHLNLDTLDNNGKSPVEYIMIDGEHSSTIVDLICEYYA